MAWRELRRRWLRGASHGGVGAGEGERTANAGAAGEGAGAAGAGNVGEGDADEEAAGGGIEDEWSPSDAEPLLYINCGGHEGLPSMLRRYERQGLLRAGERPVELLAQVQHACGVDDLYIGDLS